MFKISSDQKCADFEQKQAPVNEVNAGSLNEPETFFAEISALTPTKQ